MKCDYCDGVGIIPSPDCTLDIGIVCPKCNGDKNIDWVENAKGTNTLMNDKCYLDSISWSKISQIKDQLLNMYDIRLCNLENDNVVLNAKIKDLEDDIKILKAFIDEVS